MYFNILVIRNENSWNLVFLCRRTVWFFRKKQVTMNSGLSILICNYVVWFSFPMQVVNPSAFHTKLLLLYQCFITMCCMPTCKLSKPSKTENDRSKLSFIDYSFFFFYFIYTTDECCPLPTEMLNLVEHNAELGRPKDWDDLEEWSMEMISLFCLLVYSKRI